MTNIIAIDFYIITDVNKTCEGIKVVYCQPIQGLGFVNFLVTIGMGLKISLRARVKIAANSARMDFANPPMSRLVEFSILNRLSA